MAHTGSNGRAKSRKVFKARAKRAALPPSKLKKFKDAKSRANKNGKTAKSRRAKERN